MTSQPAPTPDRRWSLAHWLAVGAALLAAALRIPRLGSLPPQAWYDEIWFALRARELLQTGRLVAHYGIADTAGNAGLVYLTALARVFGLDSMVAARAVTALGGVISAPLAYACLRELLRAEFYSRRRTLAALAALILGYLATLVVLGRIGIEPALAPPVTLFCLWQILLGLRRSRLSHWALAGLAAGLAQYNGPHARFILPLMAFAALDALWLGRREARIPARRWPLGLAALAGVGTLVCIPLIATFVQHPDWLTGRAETVSAGVSLPDNLVRVVGAFGLAGDLNARQNVPGQPMLDGVLGTGFLVGVAWSLWRIRRSRAARILLFWLVIMSIPAALTAEAPNFGRMVGAAPPAAALAVIGWVKVADWVASRRWPVLDTQVRADLRIVGVGLAALSLGWNVETVFWRWARSPELAEAFTTASINTARDLAAREQSGQAVYVERLPEMLDEPAFTYTFAGTDVRRVDFRQCVPLLADPSGLAAYLFLPEDDGSEASFLNVYRHLDWKKADILWGREARLAEAGGGVELSGPEAWFAPGIRLLAARIAPAGAAHPGETLRLRFFWQIEASIPANLTAFAHLYGADATLLQPAAQDDRQPCGDTYPATAWRPGEIIAYAASMPLTAGLTPGHYVVAVGWYDPSTGLRSLLISADEPLPDNRAVIGQVRVSAP